jgi:hypothetical protein
MKQMEEFLASLNNEKPPQNLTPELLSLWYDGKSQWKQAHDIAQEIDDKNGSWIHAYLHRKEGDLGNASYWYSRAGKYRPSISLEEEWQELVEHFFNASSLEK